MRAWENEWEWNRKAVPPLNQEKCEENWMKYEEAGKVSDEKLFSYWYSETPGSFSPNRLVNAAVQNCYNMGLDVREAEALLEKGFKAAEEKDGAALQVITAQIYACLNEAKKDAASPYWKYRQYGGWEEIAGDVDFPAAEAVDVFSDDFARAVKAGWLGQLIGGALGTQVEGYTSRAVRECFGEIRDYLRPPETYNDDITYELAFLEAFSEKGYEVTSEDIAFAWLALIPDGYSAEEIALRNLRRGIMPPESGRVNNYFTDWIGVQMRSAIHGMAAPGNPALAAELAVRDGVISHSNSGILGGIFNAVLVSLAFVEKDARELVKKSISCIPKESEYYAVVDYARRVCEDGKSWEEAWEKCEQRFKEYNWIHAYPNAAAEIVALWFGEGDFDKTAYIITMEGRDADCTAGPVLNALGIMNGLDRISAKWLKPLGDELYTYMRRRNHFSMEELFDWTVESVRRAVSNRK